MRLTQPFDFARRRQLAERSRTQTIALTRLFRMLGWIIVAAAALWVYLPALQGAFVWEDAALIGLQPATSGPAYRDIIQVDRELGRGPERYRPMTQLSFRVDSARGGRALDFHVTSLFLHLLNIGLLYLVARRMRLSRGAAWFAALVFAVYPLCNRAVGHIGGREEVLALSFMLLAFLFHASGRWLFEPAAVLCFTLAVLARPSAAGMGLVFLAWELARGTSLRTSLARLTPFAVVGLVVLVAVRHHFGTLGLMSARESTPGTVLRTLPVAFYKLVQLMLRPFPVSEPSVLQFRAENLVPWVASWAEPRMLVGAALAIGFAAALWLTLRQGGRAFLAMVMLPALWLPLDSLYFGRAFDLTHNLYAPSVAFAILLALVVERAGFEARAGQLRRAVVAAASTVVIFSFVVASQSRLSVWRDEINVFVEAINRYPSVAAYHAAYGTALARRGDELRAVDELRRAVETEPELQVAHFNLGLLQMSLARYGEAQNEFERAARLGTQDAEAWCWASVAEHKQGNSGEALDSATRAVALDGTRPESHVALAWARLDRGDNSEAESEAHKAIAMDSRGVRGYTALAAVLRQSRRLDEALTASDHAVGLEPSNSEAALEHARCLAAAGRTSEALEELSRYTAIEPHPEKAALELRDRLKKKIS